MNSVERTFHTAVLISANLRYLICKVLWGSMFPGDVALRTESQKTQNFSNFKSVVC